MDFQQKIQLGYDQARQYWYGQPLDLDKFWASPLHLVGDDAKGKNQKFKNIILNGTNFFVADAETELRQWARNHLSNRPRHNQIGTQFSLYPPDEGFVWDLANEIDTEFESPIMSQPELEHRFSSSVLPTIVVHGLPIGTHISELLLKADIHSLILVETDYSLLKSFFLGADWNLIRRQANATGRNVRLIFNEDPVQAAVDTVICIKSLPSSHVYGVCFWQVTANDAVKKYFEIIDENIPTIVHQYGYVVDEYRQIQQTLSNLRRQPGILTGNFQTLDAIAAVVGAGPSLNASISILKKYREQFVIFACGSGLSVLLKAGIKPDYYVELETHPLTSELISRYGDDDFFEKTPLITSSGCAPDTVKQFKTVYLFLRDVSTSTFLFEGRYETLSNTQPMVGNAGLAACCKLGFKHIALFGLDCGFRETGEHHAKDVYYNDDLSKDILASERLLGGNTLPEIRAALADPRTQVVVRYPAVNGDTLAATDGFSQSKMYLQMAIQANPDKIIYQIGDGARLNGAINALPENWTLPISQLNIVEAKANITAQVKPGVDAVRHYQQNIQLLKQQHRALTAKIKYLFPNRVKNLSEWLELSSLVQQLIFGSQGEAKYAVSGFGGTIMTYFRITTQRAHSLTNPKNEFRFLNIALSKLKKLLEIALGNLENDFPAEGLN